jgi:rare lipoprotein A
MLTRRSEPLRRHWTIARVVTFALLGATLGCSIFASEPKSPPPSKMEGPACWYDVPKNSSTKKRAGQGELTAAHKTLPYGTKVRVTHLKNNKSIVVRIIDRVQAHSAIIDLSREAAEKLDIIHQGSARVRLEVLPDNWKSSAKW